MTLSAKISLILGENKAAFCRESQEGQEIIASSLTDKQCFLICVQDLIMLKLTTHKDDDGWACRNCKPELQYLK